MSSIPLVNLWAKRGLVFHFALMNIKIRFKGTYLGFVWNALEPTLTFIILYLVFTSIRFTPQENFGIYLLTGIMIYHVFVRGTNGGLTSLRSNRGILETMHIRREFFPVVATTATAMLLLIEVGVLFGLMPFFNYTPPWTVVFLPIVLAMLVILVLGISYILAIIHVYIPDIHPVWSVFIHAMFFVSPIFWYLKDVNGFLMGVQQLNPLGQLIELGHKIVVFGEIPPITEWAYTLVFVVGFFLVGYAIFQKYEPKIVEEL